MKHHLVIDTNVWISALFWKGIPSQVIRLIEWGQDIACFSEQTWTEWNEKIQEKAVLIGVLDYYVNYRKLLRQKAHFVSPVDIISLCRDSDDNRLLEAADSAHAHFLITGDKDLTTLKNFKKTRILTPAQYLKIVSAE